MLFAESVATMGKAVRPRVSEMEARSVISARVRSHRFLPRSFPTEVDALRPVFVPVRFVTLEMSGWGNYVDETRPSEVSGDGRPGDGVRYRAVSARAKATYGRLPVFAGMAEPEWSLSRLVTFYEDDLVDVSELGSDAFFGCVSKSPAECLDKAARLCGEDLLFRMREQAVTYPFSCDAESSDVVDSSCEEAYVPVWCGKMRYRNVTYRFFVNATDGVCVCSELPSSSGLWALASAKAFLAVFLPLALASLVEPDVSVRWLVLAVSFVAALLVAAVTALVVRSGSGGDGQDVGCDLGSFAGDSPFGCDVVSADGLWPDAPSARAELFGDGDVHTSSYFDR